MRHIAFVSTELAPYTPGGAGVAIGELARELERSGVRVSHVVAAPSLPSAVADGIVVARGDDDAGWELGFMATSKAAAEALSDLHRRDPVDAIEFQDFDGLAFWALTHRGDLGIASVPISVRFHGPVDLQTEAVGVTTPELTAVASMEREVYAMADRAIAPTPGIASLIIDRYSLDDRRVVVGPPQVRTLDPDARWRQGGSDFVVIGRLGEVKGSHDMVDAAVPVLRSHPACRVVFIGADGWSATGGRPMREWLLERIPGPVRDNVDFREPLAPADLSRAIIESRAVVVPSRFESFNLAVYEARRLGAPVIVPDLPTFEGILDASTGALVYDGTIAGLSTALRTFCDDPEVAESLARLPAPEIGDPLAPYGAGSVEPRHLRSQAGLATAAIARVEDAWLTPRRSGGPPSMGRRLIRRVPAPALRLATRMVPRSIRRRLRDSTDWGIEADRRAFEERFAAAAASAARRATLDPSVSVVMPCYNQGGFVREAILSVLEQVGDITTEVVVVDDGSDDGTTAELLSRLDIPTVRVIHQENRGLPAARNVGIAESRGEFVVTLDADDMLAPRYLAALGDALDAAPDAAYAHCWAELFGDTHQIWATRPYNPYQLVLSNSVVGCVLLRRSAWASVGGYDESMRSGNEDWDLWIRLMAAGYGAVQVREPLFRYRKHGVSMSVETESRHEDALLDRVRRLPELYDREHVVRLKTEWYPLLSVVLEGEDRTDRFRSESTEVIPIDDEQLGRALDEVTGKYVALLTKNSDTGVDQLVEMCRHLEGHPDLGAVDSAMSDGVRVVRAWSLFDPAGPDGVDVLEVGGSADRRLEPGSFPRPEWIVPNRIEGVPVLRQRPEEAGFIPDWVPA
jgi:glycosyltransferase involved in cell wall biosynthesis